MKLSFTTLGCPNWTFEHLIEEAERLGFDGIEVRGVNGVMRAEGIPEFFPENIDKTKELLYSHGIEICGFGTSANFHTADKARDGIDECKKAIDVCVNMGIPAIRLFGDAIPDKSKFDEVAMLVGNSIAEVCEYANGKGVEVYLEVHGDFNSIEAVSAVIDCCKKYEGFGILWDIEHSDREYYDNWRPFYESIKPHIKHTHIKDYIRLDGGAYKLCLVGEGDIPIDEIIETLENDGYKGYYSFEWEKKWHPELPEPEVAFPAYIEFMRKYAK